MRNHDELDELGQRETSNGKDIEYRFRKEMDHKRGGPLRRKDEILNRNLARGGFTGVGTRNSFEERIRTRE